MGDGSNDDWNDDDTDTGASGNRYRAPALDKGLDILEVLADQVAVLDERAFLSQIGFSAVQGDAVAPAMGPEAIEPFLLSHRHSLPRVLPLGRGR